MGKKFYTVPFGLSGLMLVAGCLGISLSGQAFAQLQPNGDIAPQSSPGLIAPTAPEQLPDMPRKESEKYARPAEPQADDAIRPAPPDAPPVVQLERSDFQVKKLVVEGNTVIPEKELRPLLTPYENRTVSLAELGKVVDAINKLYYKKGYYTSQAYIPPQNLDNQTVTIKVLEGRIGEVTVTGNRFIQGKVVKRDVDAQENNILNVQALQDRLRRISASSSAYRLKGVLTPGKENGQTNIELQVRERFPWQVSPTFDNQGRPFIGTYRWGVEAANSDLTGHGDQFRARWIAAAGTQVAAGSYFIPINRYGTQIGSTFAFSRVNLDLGIHNQTQIVGKSYDYAAVALQPLDRQHHLTLDGSLNFRRIVTYFDGDRDSANQVNIAALRLGLTFDRNDRFGRTFLRAQTSIAPGWMGANSKFWKNNLIATRVITLPRRNLLILRGNGQLTPDGLPSAELMQIGGAYSVRGYTEGLLAGDRGYSFTAEHRWPIPGLRHVSPWLDNRLQGATFFDFGNVWLDRSNKLFIEGQSHQPKRTLLAGAGVGFRLQLNTLMQGFADLGWGLVNRTSIEPNAQPSFRVHFGIRANLLPEDYRDWNSKAKAQAGNPASSSPVAQPPSQPPFIAPPPSGR